MNPLEVNQLKMPYSEDTTKNSLLSKFKHPWIYLYFIVFILGILLYYLFPKKSKIMKGG